MSETISQLCHKKPLLAAATRHLAHRPKLRRAVINSLDKHKETSTPFDLADRVIDELAKNAEFIFGTDVLEKRGNSETFIKWNLLKAPVTLAVSALHGEISKTNLECHYLFNKAKSSDKTMRLIAKGVHLSNDQQRVFITDPETEVVMVDNLLPYRFLEPHVNLNAKRVRYQTPRTITFVRLRDEQGFYQNKCLMLFHSFSDGQQSRFIVSDDKVKSFDFKPIGTSFIQDGTNIKPMPLTGEEFATNQLGDPRVHKTGRVPVVFVVDTSMRGEMGRVGEKGDKGDTGQPGESFAGQPASDWAIKALYDGKRPVLTLSEFEDCVAGNLAKAAIPMSKHFFNFLSDERKRRERDGAEFVPRLWTEVVHEQS